MPDGGEGSHPFRCIQRRRGEILQTILLAGQAEITLNSDVTWGGWLQSFWDTEDFQARLSKRTLFRA
jgi:hypothetical protein